MLIASIFILLVIITILIIFRKFVEKNSALFQFITMLILSFLTMIYVIYTKNLSETAQRQAELQIRQFKLDNRPFVYIAELENKERFSEPHIIRVKLENVGKLPARFDKIEYKIFLGEKRIEFDSKKFSKPAFIFPGQKNIYVDLPVPDMSSADVEQGKGFKAEIGFSYFSIDDLDKKNEFLYFAKYDMVMKSPYTRTIDDHVLLEISAK